MAQTGVSSVEVMNWPEFEALAKRLGIADKGETTRIEIVLDVGDFPKIKHDFIAKDAFKGSEELNRTPSREAPIGSHKL